MRLQFGYKLLKHYFFGIFAIHPKVDCVYEVTVYYVKYVLLHVCVLGKFSGDVLVLLVNFFLLNIVLEI